MLQTSARVPDESAVKESITSLAVCSSLSDRPQAPGRPTDVFPLSDFLPMRFCRIGRTTRDAARQRPKSSIEEPDMDSSSSRSGAVQQVLFSDVFVSCCESPMDATFHKQWKIRQGFISGVRCAAQPLGIQCL